MIGGARTLLLRAEKAGAKHRPKKRRAKQKGGTCAKFRTRHLVGDYLRLCKNPLHNLRGWLDSDRRKGRGNLYLFAGQGTRVAADGELRPLRTAGGSGAGAVAPERGEEPRRPCGRGVRREGLRHRPRRD